ncbi:MAG: hypothetical protein ACYTFO_06815, partial [Planctomycetota bacterium]
MWPLKRKIKQRRLEVRRSIQSAGGPGWFAQFRATVGVMPLLLLTAFYVAVLMLDAWSVEPFAYRVGQFIDRDIHARVPFVVRSADLHEKEKERAALSAPAVYALDEAYLKDLVDSLRAAPGYLATTQPGQESSPPPVPIPAEHYASWQPYLLPEGRAVYDAQIDELRVRLARLAVVSAAQRKEELTRQTIDVWVVLPDGRTKLDAGRDLIATDRLAELSAAADEAVVPLDSTIASDVKAFLVASLTARPLYVRDELASKIERQRAVDAVVAPTRLYQTGQRLVRRSLGRENGEPRGLTVEEYGLLQQEHARYLEGQRQWTLWMRFVGRGVMLAMLTGALAVYVYRYRQRVVTNRLRAVAMACLLLISLFLSKAMVLVLAWNPYVAVLPVLFATIILVIAYDQRFALMVGLLLSLFVASQLRADLSLVLVLAAATSCSAFALRDIRSRSRLIEVTALVAAIVFVVALGLSIADGVPLGFSAKDAAWAGGMALLVGFIIQGILPLIERGFNIATSMTLLEWCDASKPLLKRLAMEAPGTYNHSLQLGTMCEAAADVIGANG